MYLLSQQLLEGSIKEEFSSNSFLGSATIKKESGSPTNFFDNFEDLINPDIKNSSDLKKGVIKSKFDLL